MHRSAHAVLPVIALCAMSRTGTAAQIDGQTFVDAMTADGQSFAVHGCGHLIYRMFFTAYCSALYLAPGCSADAVLQDVPKRLELHYFYAIPATDFVKATNATIGNNVNPATLAAIRPQVDALNKLYVDIKPGDRYALTYVPGHGTELCCNGKALGTVPGCDFAQALFAIWLGEKNIDGRLRSSLLTPIGQAKR